MAYLAQDHEGCLWKADSLSALKQAGLTVHKDFPKSSPDLNAIEGVWALLHQRLKNSAPVRRAVSWLSDNAYDELWNLCTNQKLRAKEVVELEGSRCS